MSIVRDLLERANKMSEAKKEKYKGYMIIMASGNTGGLVTYTITKDDDPEFTAGGFDSIGESKKFIDAHIKGKAKYTKDGWEY